MKKRITALFICIFLTAGLFSCDNEIIQPRSRVFYDVFDTVGTFYDYTGGTEEEFSALADSVLEELTEYHRLYDIYNEYEGINNLATVNRLAGQGEVEVDRKIIDLLLFSKDIYEMTDGHTNVAMGAVLKIWHTYREEGISLPPENELISASSHTDISRLKINEDRLTVELLDPEMSLDVGAVAKGFAVEQISKRLKESGHSGYVLDVGGNLSAIGAKKNNEGWKTGIRNPDVFAENPYVYYLTIKNESIVTSGSYERFYTVNGERYHHIINKDTLMPENYYLSVSVKSPSSALSDSLSTAIFNMKPEDAESFIKKSENLFVILVLPSGEVKVLESEN